MKDYDIEDAFAAIEEELIASMMRNMKRHRVEETDEKKQWAMWQAVQLEALEKYKKANKKKFGRWFSDINGQIDEVIREANKQGYMDQELEILKAIRSGFTGYKKASGAMQAEFFKLNERKLETLLEAVRNDMEKAEIAVLRRADDQYRKAIFNAQVYANTGAGTYEKAVDMAAKDMLSAGLKCVEYANGAMHTLKDYADMAIRTASKRAYLQGEGMKRQEWGIATVIVNKRGNPCPKCLPFCGKVLVDDVWSGGSKNGISPSTGLKYPLISSAIAAGLYHPRCKDSHTTYFEGISTPPDDKYTKEELDQIAEDYRKDQKAQYAKNQADKYGRMSKNSLDSEDQKRYAARREAWKKRHAEKIREAGNEIRNTVNFDWKGSEEKFKNSEELLKGLSGEYNSRLETVTVGSQQGAGSTNMSGAAIYLSSAHPETAIHEFAHTLANSMADRYGLTHDREFWKEIKAIRRRYRKDAGNDTARWISSYEHSAKEVDEFFAEGFTHAKMRELGMDIPEKYGHDFTYSQQVLEAVDKYFKKSADSGIIMSGARIIDPFSKEAEAFAEMYYKEVRSFSTDAKKIADNLGKDESDIRKIKAYLFEDDSLFDPDTRTRRRFDPDCAIAQSWQRLITGKDIKPHDRTLIEHELLEMKIKKDNPEIEHWKAHELASEKYNYPKEVMEFYGNLEKHKKVKK